MTAQPQGKAPMAEHGPSRSPALMAELCSACTCTVVVASCDTYADLLVPFSALWRKFWPDCPYHIVLVTETEPKETVLCFDEILAMGPGHSWGWRLSHALQRLSTPRVILLCDDYLLCAPVDTARIAARVRQSIDLDALNLRLIPNPVPAETRSDDSTLGQYRKNTAYCIATQAGIWDKEFLATLSGHTDSIWEFERRGSFSFTSNDGRPLLRTCEKEFPFIDAVHKGYWEKAGIQLCKENDVSINLEKRNTPPIWVVVREWVKGVVFRMCPDLIVRIQNHFDLGWKEAKKKP